MKIAILGGTGKLGLAFAVRLNRSGHETGIGSRDAAKAEEAAKAIAGNVRGMTNREAARWCEIAIVSVPYSGHRTLLEPLKEELRGKIVVDATAPIDPTNLLQIKTDSGKSAAEETAAMLDSPDVVAAFQTISHRVLRHIDDVHDVLIAGNSGRKRDIIEVVRSMGLHPVDAGPLEVAAHLERMTVLLLSINKTNKVKESGIKITGI